MLKGIKIKAVILTALNSDLEVVNLDLTDLSVGQVEVQVKMSGLCGAQLQEIKGNKGNAKFLPHLLGHEGVGVVTNVGDGVTRVIPGDLVAMHWRIGAGIESDFPRYVLNGKTIQSGKINSLVERAIVSENRITTIPSSTPLELAAMMGCATSTAFGVLENDAKLLAGENVLVIGCGGLGLNLIHISRLMGAGLVEGVDRTSEKSTLVTELGGDHLYEALPKNKIYQVIIDTTGDVNLINAALDLLADRGRLIMVGQPDPESSLTITNAVKFFTDSGRRLIASQGGSINPSRDLERITNFALQNDFKYKSLVTDYFQLSEINEALSHLRSGMSGRIMIRIGE